MIALVAVAQRARPADALVRRRDDRRARRVRGGGLSSFVSRSASQALDKRLRSDFQLGRREAVPDAGRHAHLDAEPLVRRQRAAVGAGLERRRRAAVPERRSRCGARSRERRRSPAKRDDRIVAVPGERDAIRVLSGASSGSTPMRASSFRSRGRKRRCGAELRELAAILVLGLPLAVAWPGSAATRWRAARSRRSSA